MKFNLEVEYLTLFNIKGQMLEQLQLQKLGTVTSFEYLGATVSDDGSKSEVPSRVRGYKTFFVLNSAEHEILNARKYKSIKKFSIL